MEKQFIIPHSLVSGLLAYLQTRPYQEVAQAIPALMKLSEYHVRNDDAEGARDNPDESGA